MYELSKDLKLENDEKTIYLNNLVSNLEELKNTKLPFTKSKRKELLFEINFLSSLIETIQYDISNGIQN